MTTKEMANAFTGDIVAGADVTINTKGGSMTATLKKSLRDTLGAVGGSVAGATVEFSTGQSLVLLTGGGANVPVRVRRLSGRRFEIEIDNQDDQEVDEVTAAFLRLKTLQFVEGKMTLGEALTAHSWRESMDAKLASARPPARAPGVSAPGRAKRSS